MGEYNNLFRAEVIASRRARLDGQILITRPLSSRVILILLATIATSFILVLLLGSYTRSEQVRGSLVTDQETIRVIALRPGVITSLPVKDGQPIKKGQIVAVVNLEQNYGGQKSASQEELSSLKVQHDLSVAHRAQSRYKAEAERQGLTSSIESAKHQGDNVDEQIELQVRLIKSLETTYDRYKPIAEKGFVSQTEMDRRGQEILSARSELAGLNEKAEMIQGEIRKSRASLLELKASSSMESAADQSSAEGVTIQQAQVHGQQTYVLTSPGDGTITAIQTGVGRTVDPSVPIMTIMPKNPIVHAEVYAPSRSMGFIKPGQEARLTYDAFPFERFGSFQGRIEAVSRVSLAPRQIDAPVVLSEPSFRITIRLPTQFVIAYHSKAQLQAGMTLTSTIIIERRSFMRWVLDPVYAISGRI